MEQATTKRCARCGRVLPLGEFYRNQYYCKDCAREYASRYRSKTQGEKIECVPMKYRPAEERRAHLRALYRRRMSIIRANPQRYKEFLAKNLQYTRKYQAKQKAKNGKTKPECDPAPQDGEPVKRCARCGRLLPLRMFHRSAASRDGLQGYCKECNREQMRSYTKKPKKDPKPHKRLADMTPEERRAHNSERYAKWVAILKTNPERWEREKQRRHRNGMKANAKRMAQLKEIRANSAPTKTCSRCGRELPKESFGLSKKTADGRQNYCKECARAYFKQYRLDHPELFTRNGHIPVRLMSDEERRKYYRDYRARYIENLKQYPAKWAEFVAKRKAANERSNARQKALRAAARQQSQ